MKKLKAILLILVGFLLGALTAVGVYFITVGEVAWKEYVETTLIPNITLALTTISALAVAALPIIAKVKGAVDKFDKATGDINDTVENGRMTEGKLSEQDRRLNHFNERFDSLENKLVPIQKSADNTEKIVRIGFCNTDELVRKGYAAEIEKVGVENERETEETEP